jgi:hypothetical protein
MAASDIVKRVPPPDKLKKGSYGGAKPDEGDDMDDDGADEAAALSAMEEFMAAVKGDDAAEALRTYRNVKETC